MAEYRQIQTRIWGDSWFLEPGATEKLLFIYLFSNHRACLAGIYDLSLKAAAFETDLPAEEVARILGRFEEDGKVYFEDGLVWVPSLLRYNATNLTSAKIQANLRATLQALPECPLTRRWIAHYNSLVPERYRMDMVCIPYAEPEQTADRASIPYPEPEEEGKTRGGRVSRDWRRGIRATCAGCKDLLSVGGGPLWKGWCSGYTEVDGS